MNIILLIVDALRPDHLSFNGYSRNTSPKIDELAKESIFFPNSYATLPNTNPSVTSMLTGTYPHNNGVRMLFNNKLKATIPTLQEILQNRGYRTAFMICGHADKFGLERGFDEFDNIKWKIEDKIKRSQYKIFHPTSYLGVTQQYTDRAIKWIKKNSKNKFFLCLHYMDMHWPYDIPKPYDHFFDREYKGQHLFKSLMEDSKITRADLIFGNKKLPEEEIKHAIAHYDGGLRYIDSNIGRLLDSLKQDGIYNDTLVILSSDHGESFGEHGYYFQHGENTYEQGIKTTLLFKIPKKQCKKIDSRVQNTDIFPTVLDLLNIPIIDKIDGVSLLPLIEREKDHVRDFVFTESIENHWKTKKNIFIDGIKGKWRTMIVNDWKIIYIPHPENDIFELYNLKEDLDEHDNLIDKEKDIALKMKKRILGFMENQSSDGKSDESDLTEKSRKLLKKLGYID